MAEIQLMEALKQVMMAGKEYDDKVIPQSYSEEDLSEAIKEVYGFTPSTFSRFVKEFDVHLDEDGTTATFDLGDPTAGDWAIYCAVISKDNERIFTEKQVGTSSLHHFYFYTGNPSISTTTPWKLPNSNDNRAAHGYSSATIYNWYTQNVNNTITNGVLTISNTRGLKYLAGDYKVIIVYGFPRDDIKEDIKISKTYYKKYDVTVESQTMSLTAQIDNPDWCVACFAICNNGKELIDNKIPNFILYQDSSIGGENISSKDINNPIRVDHSRKICVGYKNGSANYWRSNAKVEIYDDSLKFYNTESVYFQPGDYTIIMVYALPREAI